MTEPAATETATGPDNGAATSPTQTIDSTQTTTAPAPAATDDRGGGPEPGDDSGGHGGSSDQQRARRRRRRLSRRPSSSSVRACASPWSPEARAVSALPRAQADGARAPVRAGRPGQGAPRAGRSRARRRSRGLRCLRPRRGGGARRPGRRTARGRPPPRQQRRHSRPGGASSSSPPSRSRRSSGSTTWAASRCLRAFLPLLEAGAPSAVVNVASVAGTVSGGPSGPYSAAKHAQVAFSRSLAGLAPASRPHRRPGPLTARRSCPGPVSRASIS